MADDDWKDEFTDPFSALKPLQMPEDHEDDRVVPLRAYSSEFVEPNEPDADFFPASSLHGLEVPERLWLVDGWIPGRTVTLFGGDGGTGKSLVAQQLAVAVAAGRKWMGRTITTGPALYISAEDDKDEIHRRLADIVRAEDISLADLDRLTLCSLAGKDALLAVPGAVQGTLMRSALFSLVSSVAADASPALIVLDTLADLFPGNENDRAQARQFIGILRGLAIEHDCAVVLLSHPSLTGLSTGTGTSGSTAWNNSVRSRIYLSRVADEGYEPDPDARVLRSMKSNYSRIGEEIAVNWRDGVFHAEESETALDRNAARAKSERVFLKLLTAVNTQGRRVSPSPSATFAPSVFAGHPDAEGCSKHALRIAMETLLSSNRISVIEEGPESKKRQSLVVV